MIIEETIRQVRPGQVNNGPIWQDRYIFYRLLLCFFCL